jgi:hypothetical protein
MNYSSSYIKRILLAVVFTAAVIATGEGGSTAGADPARPNPGRTSTPTPASGFVGPIPQIGAFEVNLLGEEAIPTFVTTQPATATVTYRPASGPGGGQLPAQDSATTHERKLTGLRSYSAYDVIVTAETPAGQKYTAQARFTTARQRVRVTLREINITDDGDGFLSGDGEQSWEVLVTWAGGKASGCYPNNGAFCETGSHGEGRIFPKSYRGQFLSWIFAEENFDTMPAAFKIGAAGNEHDDIPILSHAVDCFSSSVDCGAYGGASSPQATTEWRVPAGQDWASTPVFLDASNGGFQSTMTFTFDLFHDNLSYPSARNRPQSTWSR